MRILLLISLSLLLSVSCQTNKEKAKSDLEKLNLSGKVKSIKTYAYHAQEINGILLKGSRIPMNNFHDGDFEDLYAVFNEHGNIAVTFDYDYDKEIYRVLDTFVYTQNCKIRHRMNTKYSDTFFYDNGLLNARHLYIFNQMKGENVCIKVIYTYDQFGNLIEEQNFNTIGEKESAKKYIYNASGQLIEVLDYFLSFSRKDTSVYDSKTNNKYDANGNLVEKIITNYDGKAKSIMSFTYYPNGNIKESNEYSEENDLIWSTLFNERGEKIKVKPHPMTCSIDSAGNVVNECISTFSYNLDKHSNWIKCIEYVNGKPRLIREREIEYY